MLTLHPKEGVELLAVEVPEDGREFLAIFNSYDAVTYLNWKKSDRVKGFVEIPAGNYSFIATTKDITREQMKELVDRTEGRPNYKNYREEDGFCFTPMSSFYSLLMANGLNPDVKTYAILKRDNP